MLLYAGHTMMSGSNYPAEIAYSITFLSMDDFPVCPGFDSHFLSCHASGKTLVKIGRSRGVLRGTADRWLSACEREEEVQENKVGRIFGWPRIMGEVRPNARAAIAICSLLPKSNSDILYGSS